MKKNVVKLICLGSLSLVFSVGFAQRGGGGHSGGGGGGGHFSGGGGTFSGGSSGRSFGGNSGFGGGYRSYGSSRTNGGYSSGGYSRFNGGNRSTGPSRTGGYSHYNGGSGIGRSAERSGFSNSNRSGSASGYRHSFGNSRFAGAGGLGSARGATGVYHRSNLNASGSGVGNRQSVGFNGGFASGHATESRSGTVAYSGNHNTYSSGGQFAGNQRIGTPPHGLIGGQLGGQGGVGRVLGNNGGFGLGGFGHDGFRHGYCGYGGGWGDNFFCFPFYCFDPFVAPCFASPWYCYPCLPAYVAQPNVIIENVAPSSNWSGTNYEWSPESNSSANPVLDDSVEDLVQSFEADDHKAIDRVTPHSGNVRITSEGKYNYSLNANDFYDTYVDGIESTKTERFEIMDVKAGSNGESARVIAKHIYNDPSGNRTSVYQSYLLVKEGNEYVIREFGTSDSPIS